MRFLHWANLVRVAFKSASESVLLPQNLESSFERGKIRFIRAESRRVIQIELIFLLERR